MSDELKERILKALKTANSQQPVPLQKLLGLGAPNEVRMVLGDLYAKRQVMNCSITRNGVTEMYWWPTGVVALPSGPEMFVISRPALERSREQRVAAAKPTTEKEKIMAAPSNLRTVIYDKIVEFPGILRKNLVEFALVKCPDITEKQAVKAVANLVTAKKVRLDGKGNEARCHLAVGVSQPAAARAAATPKLPKLPKKKKTRPIPERPRAQKAQPPAPEFADRSFSVMLDDENFLHICQGDQKLILNPVQVDRLGGFIDRMGLTGRAG